VASLIATAQFLGVASPVAQRNVLLTAVYCCPDNAEPFTVLHSTLAAPLEPPLRFTAIVSVPLFCTTAAVDLCTQREPVVVAACAAPAKFIAPHRASAAMKDASA
jgi:hypothetical protein